MIRINTLLEPAAVVAESGFATKSAMFERIADIASQAYGLDRNLICEGLIERERLGPTGFGGGTAIPHCKIDAIHQPVGIFLRLKKAVDYDAVDDEPVDLVFALISPARDGSAHLRALAEVSRMFRNEKFCIHLRGAAGDGAIFALLQSDEERNAA
jgi:nitrogen PTS system EIIA component